MAWSHVNRIRHGKAAIDYLICDTGHNGHELRNVSVSCVNMIPDGNWLRQFRLDWNRVNRAKHPTQAIGIILSFSRKEIEPGNPEAVALAEEIALEFVKRHYPGRRALICCQQDGVSGLLHAHILNSDVAMDNLKGCDSEQYHAATVARWVDEVASEYITLDKGASAKEKTTITEKKKREKGEFVWKDYLREKICDAKIAAESEDDFYKRLSDSGVDAVKRSSQRRGEYLTYELLSVPDGEAMPKHSKARSYNLGADFSPEAIRSAIAERQGDTDEASPVLSKTKTDNNETECVEPEADVEVYIPDVPLIPIAPPTKDDEKEEEREKDEEKRRAMRRELQRNARHAEIMRKFGNAMPNFIERNADFEMGR